MQRRRRVDDELTLLKSLKRRGDDLGVLFEWAKGGEDVGVDLQRGLDEFQQEIDTAESKKMLSGEHDQSNAIVTIHPGAGGTESQDWAEMLLRMYLKWSERKGFRRELMDYQPGEEAAFSPPRLAYIAWCGSRRSIKPHDAIRHSPRSSSGPSCRKTSMSRSTTRTFA